MNIAMPGRQRGLGQDVPGSDPWGGDEGVALKVLDIVVLVSILMLVHNLINRK